MTEKSATTKPETRPISEGSGPANTMLCLDENTVNALLDGTLDPVTRETARTHLDVCETCRQVVGLVAGSEHRETTSPDPTNQNIDHFEVESRIARGGMGEIYRARDTQLNRIVALKLISADLLDTPEVMARFVVEAQATARLNHPNIVAIYSVGKWRERPYLALEYVQGESLRNRMNRGLLRTGEILSVAQAVAEALTEAHAHDVLHRDLKPDNVMLAEDGRTRVVDFGLARLLRPSDPNMQVSAPGVNEVRGTPSYLSPEQWKGLDPSPAIDIWAFGILLYELVAGHRPYEETNMVAQALKVCEPVAAPVAPPAACSEEIAGLIAECLHKDPARRPAALQVRDRIRGHRSSDRAKLVDELEESAELWQTTQQSPLKLWGADQLSGAQIALSSQDTPISAPVVRFMGACHAQVRHGEQRRRLVLMSLLGLTICLSVVAALLANSLSGQKQAAQVARDHAVVQRTAAVEDAAAALTEGARTALDDGRYLEARAKLRSALEMKDGPLARVLWWRLSSDPILWSQNLGTGTYDAAYSPDGTRIAVAGQDKTVYLIDPKTSHVTSLRGHTDQVLKVAFSQDGKFLASASWSGALKVWNLENGSVRDIVDRGPRPSALLMTSQRLWVGFAKSNTRALSLKGGKDIEFAGKLSSGLARRGNRVLGASPEGAVHIFNTEDPEETESLTVDAKLSAIATNPSWVAVGDVEGAIHLVDLADNTATKHYTGVSKVRRLGFTADGLLIARQDGRLQKLNIESERFELLGQHARGIWGLAIGPEGVVSASVDGTVTLRRLHDVKPAFKSEGHRDGVASGAFSLDGSQIASGGYDGLLRIWDAKTARQMAAYAGHEGTIYGVAASPTTWASAGRDSTVRVWDRQTGKQRHVLRGHEGIVYGVAFSPDGLHLASASADGTVRLWDPVKGRLRAILRGHGKDVFEVSFDHSGRWLASGSADRTVRIWDLQRLKASPKILTGHEGHVWGLSWSPDARRIATGSYDGTVRVFDLKSGTSETIARHEGRVYSVALSKDGTQVVSAGADMKVRRSPVSGGESTILLAHRGEVNEVRIFASQVLSVSDDGTVRLSKLQSGLPVWSPRAHQEALTIDESGQAQLRLKDGAIKTLRTHASGVYEDETSRWVADEDRAFSFDGLGAELESMVIPKNVTALAPRQDTLVLGFENGRIEFGDLHLESTPSARVRSLRSGPMNTIAAGFDDGTFGLWDASNGTRLLDLHMHGPVDQLTTHDGRWSASSELGTELQAFDAFKPSRCAVLNKVWAAVPVLFAEGRIRKAAPPKDHACGVTP